MVLFFFFFSFFWVFPGTRFLLYYKRNVKERIKYMYAKKQSIAQSRSSNIKGLSVMFCQSLSRFWTCVYVFLLLLFFFYLHIKKVFENEWIIRLLMKLKLPAPGAKQCCFSPLKQCYYLSIIYLSIYRSVPPLYNGLWFSFVYFGLSCLCVCVCVYIYNECFFDPLYLQVKMHSYIFILQRNYFQVQYCYKYFNLWIKVMFFFLNRVAAHKCKLGHYR